MADPPRRSRDPFAEAVRGLGDGQSADARWVRTRGLTIRFANGRIHQPHFDESTHVSFRVADDRRLGIATTGDTSAAGLAVVRDSALGLARVAPLEPSFLGFRPGGGPATVRVPFSASTAALSPEAVTKLAERILSAAEAARPGGRIAGAVNVGSEELRVTNSAGLDRRCRTSVAQASDLVDFPEKDPPVSGWSEGAHWDATHLDPERLGSEAAERTATSEPGAVPPGAYRVVLRGPALAEGLAFLAHLGFSGQGEVEGWSCLRRRRGARVAPEFVTLDDDPRSRLTIPLGIDYEGTATRRTSLVDHGVACPAVTDLLTAGRLRRELTGHAPPPEAPWGEFGPSPGHLVLKAGDASEDELVRETRRGILVTRFHYVRVVDPGRGVITGMTRDGTYRIEKGEVVGPVRNLRFTESVLTLLRGLELLGRQRHIYCDESGGSCVTTPSASVRSFRFTSATLF
jgi:predicted Zn-dependent protease